MSCCIVHARCSMYIWWLRVGSYSVMLHRILLIDMLTVQEVAIVNAKCPNGIWESQYSNASKVLLIIWKSNIIFQVSFYYWMRSRWPQPHYLKPDPISLTGFTQMCWEPPHWLSMRHLADLICCHPLYQTLQGRLYLESKYKLYSCVHDVFVCVCVLWRLKSIILPIWSE